MNNYITCDKCRHEELDCQCTKCYYCDNTSLEENDFVDNAEWSRDENRKLVIVYRNMCTECKQLEDDRTLENIELMRSK